MTKPTTTGEHPRNMLEARDAAAASLKAFSANALRCVTSDLATFARLSDLAKGPRHRWKRNEIETQLSRLPCDPVPLRPIVERIMPERLRVTKHRWSTCRSSIARVLEIVGEIDGSEALDVACTPDWEALFECIGDEEPGHAFRRFARFCCWCGIQPDGVNEETLEQYRQWLLTRTLNLKVGQRINTVRMIWNQHASTNPVWPRRLLTAPPRCNGRFQTDALNPAYIRSVDDDYVAKLRHRDPLDPLFPKVITPAVLKQKREVLIRAGCTLIAEGRRADTVSCLSSVTKPDAVRLVLLDLFNRLGGGKEWPPSAVYTARHLLEAAIYVHATEPESLSDGELITVRGYCKLVKLRNSHLLSKRTRERLAVLEDPEMEKRFLDLPNDAFDDAARLLAEGRPSQAAHLHQAALALAIDILEPLRGGMLSLLDTRRHFQRDGRSRVIALRIPAEEVEKSVVDIEALIPRKMSQHIARHERIYIPIITDGKPSTALFPNLEGKPLHRDQLSQSIVKLVRDKLGIEFNLHLVRHWVTDVILDDDPRNGATAQHVLAHRNPTSKRRYAVSRLQVRRPHWRDCAPIARMLPVRDWPATDRAAWDRACFKAGPLDPSGKLAHLQPASLNETRKGWAKFLMFLSLSGELLETEGPADRITPDRMGRFILSLRGRLSPISTQSCIYQLASAIEAMEPDRDWQWLRSHPGRPRNAEVQRGLKRIVPPDPAELLAGALEYCDAADLRPVSIFNSVAYRDGLIVALGTYFAPRRKNIFEMKINEHLIIGDSESRIVFNSTVKNDEVIKSVFPQSLEPYLRRYLTHHRVVLLGRHDNVSALWINMFGEPLDYAGGFDVFQRIGKRVIGRRVNVHSVRYAMATATLDHDSHDIELASAGLAHRGTGSVARIYDKGGPQRAKRAWRAILKRRRSRR